MEKRRARFVPGVSFATENLERRLVLSAIGSTAAASAAIRKAATKTTLEVNAGTLGLPITLTATVRAPATSGAPAGTVEIVDHGAVLGTLTLSPTASTDSRYAYSRAIGTLVQPAGGTAYYFGKHQVSAVFVPDNAFSKSTGKASFTVSQPSYTSLAGGVEVATIVPGTGPQIQSGQTANVLYTGYLAKNGKIFDDSSSHGGTPFSFTVGGGQVVQGFDEGTAGMQPGETRIILIPAAEGYGSKANGSIPANSTLIFEVTLASIS